VTQCSVVERKIELPNVDIEKVSRKIVFGCEMEVESRWRERNDLGRSQS
jgi:hypothetical protein